MNEPYPGFYEPAPAEPRTDDYYDHADDDPPYPPMLGERWEREPERDDP